MQLRDIPGEVPWHLEAVGNAAWLGPALADVLRLAGAAEDAGHVALAGLDEVERGGARFGFGGSIPLAKALRPEVILALEMNGEALPPAHGAPLRLVVPGVIGARSVKWLGDITVQDAPSDNYFQAVAYRLLSPDAPTGELGQMLGEIFVTVAICQPAEGARLPTAPVTLRGYALGGGGHAITQVEVSANNGSSWKAAELLGESPPWAWQLWQATLELPPGRCTLVARAYDAHGGEQPAAVTQTWNAKGYMNNAWHRVGVEIG
jgi:sulfite oxidase